MTNQVERKLSVSQFARGLFISILAFFGCAGALARADGIAKLADTRLDAIVVTAKKRPDAAADEKVKRQVEAALHSDPFFYDEHVTVTAINGVITLEGMVFDDWDLRNAMRISRKIPGVRRVINNLEIKLGGE
jgi:osmotically-inducible protein OsmY